MVWWLDKKLRAIRKTPQFSIATLPEVTIGRLVGVAKALDGKTVVAPFSGRVCLAYFAKATDTNAHRTGDILVVAEETGGVPFLLEDDSGVAVIDPDGATCTLDVDHKASTSDVWGDITDRQRLFLERYQAGSFSYGSLHWYEAIVEIDERIAVVGYGQRGDRLRMSSSPHLPLVICDNLATTNV